MGIIKRFSDIMKANINDVLDKAEDPAKMADQMERDLRENLANVKKETAGVMAAEKQAKRALDACGADIAKYAAAARNALASGAEDDARTLLSTKQAREAELDGLQKTYDMAHANAVKMQDMHDKLVRDIEAVSARKANIKAKIAAAKAQEAVNKATAGASAGASLAAFDRMEAKADKMLDTAAAEAELGQRDASAEDLASKYAKGGPSSVDAELAALKAELAGGEA